MVSPILRCALIGGRSSHVSSISPTCNSRLPILHRRGRHRDKLSVWLIRREWSVITLPRRSHLIITKSSISARRRRVTFQMTERRDLAADGDREKRVTLSNLNQFNHRHQRKSNELCENVALHVMIIRSPGRLPVGATFSPSRALARSRTVYFFFPSFPFFFFL